MKPDFNNIFSSSSCLSLKDMKDYISGKLSESDMRRIEMHVADCQMCNDELEGLSNMKDMNSLNKMLISINEEIDKFSSGTESTKGRNINIKRILSVAAAVVLLVAAGYTVNYMFKPKTSDLAEMKVPQESAVLEESKTEISEDVSESVSTQFDSVSYTKETDEYTVQDDKEERILKDIITEETTIINDRTEEAKIENKDEEILAEEFEEIQEEETKLSDLNNRNIVSVEKSNKKNETAKTDIADEAPAIAADEDKNKISFGKIRGNTNRKKTKSVSSETVKGIKTGAELSYDEKVYDEAVEGFNKYLQYNPYDYDIIYKKGKSLYFIKNYDAAVSEFNKIIDSPSSNLKEDAEWYKTLCFIRQGKISEAKAILEKIISQKGKYRDQSVDLLERISDQ